MKRILFFLFCLSSTSFAQTPFDTQVGAWRIFNNTNVTSSTAPHSITPFKVGAGIGDSLAYYLIAEHDSMRAALSGSTGLQGTLNAGNTATNSGSNVGSYTLSSVSGQTNSTNAGLVDISNSSFEAQHTAQWFRISNVGASIIGCSLFADASYNGEIDMYNSTGLHSSRFLSTTLSADHINYLPDEDGILVTHTTSTPINIGVIGSAHANLDVDKLRIMASGTVIAGILGGGGTGYLQLKDPSSVHNTYFTSGTLSADRTFTTPNRDGTIELQGDQINPTKTINANCGVGATAILSGTADDRSGTITLTTGTGTSSGLLLTITFHQAYPTHTRVLIQCVSGGSLITTVYAASETNTIFTVLGTVADATTYVITYIVQN